MSRAGYVHGTSAAERARLAALNRLTNPPFLEFLETSSRDVVLEIGSGLGILLNEVARRVPRGQALGVECSAEQLAATRVSRSNVHVCQADAHWLPFPTERFDVAYCRYLLEHVAEPSRVLNEMHRVLKPGGRAFVQENNISVHVLYPECPKFDSLWRQLAAAQEKLGGDSSIGKKLFALLKAAGFREIRLSLAPEVHHAGQDTFDVWMDNLVGNVAGAAEKMLEFGLSCRSEIEGALEELERFRKRDDGSAIFYWNRVRACK